MSDDLAPVGAAAGMLRVELIPLPKWKKELRVRFLGNPSGLLVHHRHKAIGVPCGQQYECRLCRQRQAPKWKGYTSVLFADQETQQWVHGIIEITEGLKPLFDDRDLRGEEWFLCLKEDRKGRFPAQARRGVNVVPERLPAAVNVLAWCKWFYSDEHLEMEAKVRRPAMVMAEPVAIADAAPVQSVPIEAARPAPDRLRADLERRGGPPKSAADTFGPLMRRLQERSANGPPVPNGNGQH